MKKLKDSTMQETSQTPSTKPSERESRRKTTPSEAGEIVGKAYQRAMAERLEKMRRGEEVREI